MMPAVAGDEDRSWTKGDFVFRRPIKHMGKRPYWTNSKNRERLKERK
jgi:hypothetical protein